MADAKIVTAGQVPTVELPNGRGRQSRYITAADGGQFSLIVNELKPGSPPGDYHHHERSDSTYFVLSGQLEACIDGKSVVLGPGEAAFIPRGVKHGSRNGGSEPCRFLEVHAPPLDPNDKVVAPEAPRWRTGTE